MWRAWHRTRIGAYLVLVLAGLVTAAGAAEAFNVRAPHAGIYDPVSGEWLYAKSADDQVPVASLTKLVAALTFFRLGGDLDTPVTIRREDWKGAGRTRLRVGDVVPARTLLKMALVCSDNCAARALVHPFALSYEAYGYHMQETVWGLGCRNSTFVEPTGLNPANRSTVREIVHLFLTAYENPVLRECLGTSEFDLETRRGPRTIVHSSRLKRARDEVLAAKTGYLSVAGYCLAQAVGYPEGEIITVVLGTRSRSARNRESIRLMERGHHLLQLRAAAEENLSPAGDTDPPKPARRLQAGF